MNLKKATDATTRAHAQAPQTQEGAQATQQAPAAATAATTGDGPAVAAAPAPTQTTPAPDEHAGRGGLYRRNADGTRTLIERTQREAAAAPQDTQAG